MEENRELDRASGIPWAQLVIAGFLLACLVLLATLLVPAACREGHPHDFRKAKADIVALAAAVSQYAIDHGGAYPPELGALLLPDEHGLRYLEIDVAPRDPWGHRYGYEPPAGSTRFRVFSLGADGREGGEGDDRDLDNLLIEEGRL